MNRLARTCRWTLAVAALALSGCGGASAQVSGRVTVDDKPLETGTVTFHSADGNVVALGHVGADGKYAVAIDDGGIPPGEYVVTVAAAEVAPEEFGEEEAAPKLLVPGKYTTKETSDLRFTVEPGAQTIDLALQKGS